jgi:hypothetical protein
MKPAARVCQREGDQVLGRYVSDLEVGDVLGPMERTYTPFLVREYAHAIEETAERYLGASGVHAPPTTVHTDKKRLLDDACPDGGGPTARLHLIYDALYHTMVPSSQPLEVGGEVVERYQKRGRHHLVIEFEVRDKMTGALYTTYRDTTLLGYRPEA